MKTTIKRYVYFYYTKFKNLRKYVKFLGSSNISISSTFEGHNSIGVNNSLNNVDIGLGTYTGTNVRLSNVKVGRFCSIASNVSNVYGNHPLNTFVSTHPAFFSIHKAAGFTFSKSQRFAELTFIEGSKMVIIGNDVWIGENVTIMSGVKIGDGAVIGANSLVTKDIMPYSINIGSPTKILKYRFEKEDIEFLMLTKWWEFEFAWIQEHSELFSNIQMFKRNIIKKNHDII
jgi:acetyltransferase-like isoleucine patch superfamily enzyme